MLDCFNREINYLRVSVTDRCNLRCVYCMPPEGVCWKKHEDILSYEQITAIVKEAAALGMKKVRLTGGEPLARKDIEKLVGMLSQINDLSEICMTTNGILLAEKAEALKQNGLGRVNISIDSIDYEKYRAITRGGDLNKALEGLDAAIAFKLTPVKVNMVVFQDTNRQEIDNMRKFCGNKGVELQLIRHFTLDNRNAICAVQAETHRPKPCEECNRLRLTADGYLKPCLFSEKEIRVDFSDIRGSIIAAVRNKPQKGEKCGNRKMHQIGG